MAPALDEFGGADVAENVPLGPLTTLRVGPIARRLITCVTAEQITETLRELHHRGETDVLVLAGGSNVVVADDLAELTVVRIASAGITIDGGVARAQAGVDWDGFVSAAIAAGLGGLECLSGIPGSVGATPVQNVGAYGVEVADVLRRVRLLDRRTFEVRWVPADELKFGYRHSVLKESADAVVLEVEFALNSDGRSAPIRYRELASALGVSVGEHASPAHVRDAVLALRSAKGMVLDATDHDTWSVGSFFTNPVVSAQQFAQLRDSAAAPVPNYPAPGGVKLAAGWLVEQAGFGKGFPGSGPCRLSTKHALALSNRGGATTADILGLARTVRDGVRAVFDVTLVPEPVMVGCAL